MANKKDDQDKLISDKTEEDNHYFFKYRKKKENDAMFINYENQKPLLHHDIIM